MSVEDSKRAYRRRKIEIWRYRRQHRNFKRGAVYASRQEVALRRERIKGRFVGFDLSDWVPANTVII